MSIEVQEFLKTFAKGRYANARLQQTPEILFVILKDTTRASTRQLALLENKVSSLAGSPVEIILHSDHLRETFLSALGSILSDALDLTVEGAHFELIGRKRAQVFLSVSARHSEVNSALRGRIVDAAKSIGDPLGIEEIEVEVSGQGQSTINDALVLREVLKIAPVTPERLAEALNANETILQDFSKEEVGVMLDRLRRKKLLVWQPSGTYVPAQSALYLYSSPRSRTSSDIERALELGRKRW